jgi:hypothetical protein
MLHKMGLKMVKVMKSQKEIEVSLILLEMNEKISALGSKGG